MVAAILLGLSALFAVTLAMRGRWMRRACGRSYTVLTEKCAIPSALALKASARPGDRRRAMIAGFDTFLSKPVDIERCAGRAAPFCEPRPITTPNCRADEGQ